MATPLSSRYPRPLKATRAYLGGSPGLAGVPCREDGCGGYLSRPLSSPSCCGVSKTPVKDLCRSFAEEVWGVETFPIMLCHCEDDFQGEKAVDRISTSCWRCRVNDLRRCYSAGSLAPELASCSVDPHKRCEERDLLLGDYCCDSLFSRKRSKSCSSADRLKSCGSNVAIKPPPRFKISVAGHAHTRISVEGLNQEVSSALEGNPTHLFQTTPTDGRTAPVRDLLGTTKTGKTPPTLSISMAHNATTPSSSSSSPRPLPSSPSSTSSAQVSDLLPPGNGSLSLESPAHLSHLPPSPKPSFAHDPPVGAERCSIRINCSIMHQEDQVLRGPDKSKGTITFKGNVFSPLVV